MLTRYTISINPTRKDLPLNLTNVYFLKALKVKVLKLFSIFTFIHIVSYFLLIKKFPFIPVLLKI